MSHPDRTCPPDATGVLLPLLAQLRQGTRAAHASMETVPAFACLLAPALGAADYVAALQGLHAFHASLSRRLRRLAGGAQPCLEHHDDGLRALAMDIAWFGAVPRPALRLPARIATPAAAWGAAYVLEGSALGARVIGRAVSQSLRVGPGAGGEYFCGPTADAARDRWQDFARALNDAGAAMGPGGCRQAVSAARASFAALEWTMRRGLPALPTAPVACLPASFRPAAAGQAMN